MTSSIWGQRRYEIVDTGDWFFRYTVYKYYGEDVYPDAEVVTTTVTRWGARSAAVEDARQEDKRQNRTLVDTLVI